MRNFLFYLFITLSTISYGQLTWQQIVTDANATISVGEGNGALGQSDPTLNGVLLPSGSLIGVFFINDQGEYIFGGGATWTGPGDPIAIAAWGSESGLDNGFTANESFNWFVKVCDGNCWTDLNENDVIDSNELLSGSDYISNDAQMLDHVALDGTTYSPNGLFALESADFIEYVEGDQDDEVLECECSYGVAFDNAGVCFILNACSDPLASNYCPGPVATTYLQEACTYDEAIEGCMCSESYNFDSSASVDDGTCFVISGGCSDPLASNYSGSECATALFNDEDCQYGGCMCSESYNYDVNATVDDGSCVVLSGGCSDILSNNYSGDLCVNSIFANEDCQYAPVDIDFDWTYNITDGNMTIQISASDVVTFNEDILPNGSLIGAFYTNAAGELTCGGYQEWTGEDLALAVWASESGLNNGFQSGEIITWGISVFGEDFIASSSTMNSLPPFSETFISNGFGQLLQADFEGELEGEQGCTNIDSFNYNENATIDDGSCYSLDFDYTITDANMTIQVGVAAIQLNGELGTVPNGSLLGAFYTNIDGQLQCGGYGEWTGSDIAVAVWGSESGLDNGFEPNEEITWILSIYGQEFISSSVTMNPIAPFSPTYVGNGFGQLLLAVFEGEVIGVFGCMNETATNYNSSATIDDGSCIILGCTDFSACNYDDVSTDDDGSCYFESIWYYDEDGDGLGDYQEYVQTSCDQPVNWVDNFNDPCPGDEINDSDGNGICDSDEILGCTNINSSNYDFFANVDDGSCIIPGCTDESAVNYSEEANIDNGSCITVVYGCLEPSAFNYNESANTNDDSCCYITACTDENAFNYNPNACFDDGSCIDIILGCTNPSSFNYNSSANTDDNSCVDYIYGCDDVAACNYDSTVNTPNGSCIYANLYYDCDDNCINDSDGDLVCDELEIFGCTELDAYNYNIDATEDDGSCIDIVLGCLDSSALNYNALANTNGDSCCFIEGCLNSESFNYNPSACFDNDSCIEIILGCTEVSAFNYNPLANIDDGLCVEYIYGCIDTSACNYDELANTDNSSCSYADELYDCDGICLNDLNNNGTCDELEISGCTNPIALNYNPDATDDNGVCIIAGCMDSIACNYDSQVNFDDTSCTYPLDTYLDCSGGCLNDTDGDSICDEIEVLGCQDPNSCNYNSDATDEDDSCYNNNLGCGCDQPAADTYYDCSGACLLDIDGDGICDELEISGCTDTTACNYDSVATDDDSSCYNNDLGCGCDTVAAENGYDCDGNCLIDSDNDGVCDEFEIVGCPDSSACNYEAIATDDGSCNYAEAGYDCLGNLLSLDTPWGNNSLGCDPFNNHIVGFSSSLFNIGDYIGLFYTNDSGELMFAQGYEVADELTFSLTICGDDTSTPVKDGFDVGENMIWQLWPEGEDCSYSIGFDYSENGVSSLNNIIDYQVNGMSIVNSVFGSSLTATASVTDALCNGGFGSVELTVSGGTFPYEIDDLSFLLAGSYSSTVTDANGCSVIIDFDIAQPDELEVSALVTDASCNGAFGSALVEITGGVEPYDITYFENGLQLLANNEYFNSLAAGVTHSFIILDSNGCSLPLEFDVSEPDELEVSVSVTDALCNGGLGSVELTISGGTAPYTFFSNTMDFDPVNFDVWENPLELDMEAGSHSYGFTDSNGCLAFVDFTILEPELLEASVSVTDVLCNGDFGSAELIVTGGTAPYDIEDLSALSAGSYTTIVSDSNGCSVIIDFDIAEPDELEVSASVTDALCNFNNQGGFGSALVEITGGVEPYDITYFENGLQLLANDEYFNSLAADVTHSFIILDSNGCSVSLEFDVSQPDELEVSVSVIDALCNGGFGSAELTISGGAGNYNYEIQESIESELIVINDLDNLFAGDYIVTVIDGNGCLDFIEFSISHPESLSIILDSSSGEYSNCNSGSASVLVSGGTSEYEYLWSNGETSSEITGLCGGEYTVIVTDENGCVIEGLINVDYVTPDGWDVIESVVLHHIDIPANSTMLLDQAVLTYGDYIGVFSEFSDECYGYIMWEGESTQLVANIDPANIYMQIYLKVWDNETQTEALGFAVYDNSYPDERYFEPSGESGLLGAVFATHQVIPLNENINSDWDMISTYINNVNDINTTLAPVLNELIIIKDANGNVYWPSVPVLNLDEINTHDAYAVKTYAPNDLTIYGDFIQPEEIVFELSGWNYISYPRYYPEEVDVVFESMLSNIELLKDDNGSLYWPELNINTIGQMEAGEGYIMKVGEDQLFTYPSNSDYVTDINGSTTAGRYGLIEPSYFTDIEKTSSNMVIGLPENAWLDFDIQYGDEIAVYDSQGMIAGVSVLDISNNTIVVWEDDISSSEKDGMIEGDLLYFELWQSSTNTLYNLEIDWKDGGDTFFSNGISIASLISVNELVVDNFQDVSCYPNPNDGEFTLEFKLLNQENVNIILYNALGEKVFAIENNTYDKGLNLMSVSLPKLTRGLYYLELSSSSEYSNVIIDLTK